jgi:beta-phosphoglucomutase-like phosphatase (HAD superfamily)
MSIVSPNYRAVVFDLDGTLLDTIDDIAGAMNRVLESRHLEPYGIEAYKGLVGDGIEEMVRRALRPALSTTTRSPASSATTAANTTSAGGCTAGLIPGSPNSSESWPAVALKRPSSRISLILLRRP